MHRSPFFIDLMEIPWRSLLALISIPSLYSFLCSTLYSSFSLLPFSISPSHFSFLSLPPHFSISPSDFSFHPYFLSFPFLIISLTSSLPISPCHFLFLFLLSPFSISLSHFSFLTLPSPYPFLHSISHASPSLPPFHFSLSHSPSIILPSSHPFPCLIPHSSSSVLPVHFSLPGLVHLSHFFPSIPASIPLEILKNCLKTSTLPNIRATPLEIQNHRKHRY